MLTGNDVAVLLGLLAAAVTLAGFAGIVTSIDRSAAAVSAELTAFRISRLVLTAIRSAFLAFLPILLDAFEVEPENLWRLAAVVSTIFVAEMLIMSVFSNVASQLFKQVNVPTGASIPMFYANIVIGLGVLAFGFAGIGGLVPGRGCYFLGLFYFQYLMFFLYYRMILVADQASRRWNTSD